MTREDIVSKVQKLLALSTSSNEHEAALAAAKAREFLSKYNLDLAEVLEKDSQASLEVEENEIDCPQQTPLWIWMLAQAVADAFDCKVLQARIGHRGAKFLFIGVSADSKVAVYTYTFLKNEIERLSKSSALSLKGEAQRIYGGGYRHFAPSFRSLKQDYSTGVVARIRETLEAQVSYTRQSEAAACTALVVRKEQEINKFMAMEHPNVRTVNSRGRSISASAYNRGYADGANINIRPGVGAGRQAAIGRY